jgi:uncharacterized protein (DUF2336 family)
MSSDRRFDMVKLTHETVMEFAGERSWTMRAKVIDRVATRYVDHALAPAERPVALELFRLALADGEKTVRRILAESLKNAATLPRDIVDALAQDAPEVSAPFLAASPLLAEDDLIAIATSGTGAQREAIACRAKLSERLARILHFRQAAA